ASEHEKRLMNGRGSILADAKSAVAVQPRQGPLHIPAVDAQAAAVRRLPTRDPGPDASATHPASVRVRVAAAIAVPFPRPTPRAGGGGAGSGGIASTHAIVGTTSGTFAAVMIAARGMPWASTITACWLPFFRLSTGLGPVLPPPPRARTKRLSIRARLPSIVS